jgi:8-oxo-dGTP pyrophosphatase MutT (NUDIX family)
MKVNCEMSVGDILTKVSNVEVKETGTTCKNIDNFQDNKNKNNMTMENKNLLCNRQLNCFSDKWKSATGANNLQRKDPFESFRKQGHRTVCGSCIISQGHVLLVKQRECEKWGFPKGSKEWTESKYACMVRELREETGIQLHQVFHEYLFSKTFFESTIYFFKMPSIINNLKPNDTREIEMAAWVPLTELKNMCLNRITDFIKRNVLLRENK